MENFTSSPFLPVVDDEPCDSQNEIYNYVLYGVAGGIIILLSLLEIRSNKDRCVSCGGHPGLVIPVNLVDHNNDRLSIAAAFGSMASVCFKLFTTTDSYLKYTPAWSKTFVVMLSVLSYGLLYYPIFACLSTSWIFLGSFLGIAFSFCLFLLNLQIMLNCAGNPNEGLPGQTIAIQIPVLACLSFLMLRFTLKFSQHLYTTIKMRQILPEEERRVASSQDITYVKSLLYSASYTSFEEYTVVRNLETSTMESRLKLFWKKISSYLYQNDPTFRYSPRIIAIFTVAIICVYQFSIIVMLVVRVVYDMLDALQKSENNTTNATSIDSDAEDLGLFEVRLILKVFIGSVLCSFVISLAFSLWSTFQILTNYRTISKRMFKGDFKAINFKRSDFYAQTILSYSLCYAGSQIAYLLWGYLVTLVFLFLTCLLVAYLIVLPLTGDLPFSVFKAVILNVLPGFGVIGVFRLVQFLWSRLLLHKIDTFDDTGQPTSKAVLALNNRRVYHNVSFFLFLFYIVLGIFGCFFTILKGMFLGIIHLSRLDRCRLMSGFESWDAAYLYFISFLYLEQSHRHPVLLVFCDTLLEKRRLAKGVKLHNVSRQPEPEESPDTLENHSASFGRSLSVLPRSTIRWLKAYTLIRNPSLIVNEEDGYEKVEHSHVRFSSIDKPIVL